MLKHDDWQSGRHDVTFIFESAEKHTKKLQLGVFLSCTPYFHIECFVGLVVKLYCARKNSRAKNFLLEPAQRPAFFLFFPNFPLIHWLMRNVPPLFGAPIKYPMGCKLET